MKRIIQILIIVCLSVTCCGCSNNNKESYLRVHIRANSNLTVDQEIKYKIKDELVNYLTPLIADCNCLNDVKLTLNSNKENIELVCNAVLKNNGFTYCATAKIDTEFFPTRMYGEYVLEADFYDALIVELGDAVGDNWWCVVYPPLCFLNAKQLNTNNIKYKSKLIEIVNNFFD